jgi:Tfp pilus assembly protein PilN
MMGVWLLLIAILCVAFFGLKYYKRSSYLEWLQEKVRATEQDAEHVESTRSLLKEILRLNSASSDFFKDLIHLYNTLPREMYLTDLTLSKDRLLDMRGRSDKMTSVFDFVNQLKSRPTFQEVETRQLTKRIADNKEVVDFEIHCRLSTG